MTDTTAAERDRYFSLLQKLAPERRLEAAVSLSSAVRALAEAGVLRSHPGCSPGELRARLAVRLYGRDVARRLFGEVPDDAT